MNALKKGFHLKLYFIYFTRPDPDGLIRGIILKMFHLSDIHNEGFQIGDATQLRFSQLPLPYC